MTGTPTFTALDWVVVGVYFAGMLAIGVALARRQKTTEELFLAGR
jgi:Na+/proline symporter